MANKPPPAPPASLFGPAPSRDDAPATRPSQARTVRVSAVREAVNSGQYVIDKDAVARNLVDEELGSKVK
jgi:hypothetical protein